MKMKLEKFIGRPFRILLSENSKEKAENYIIWLAIISFAIHLLLILLSNLEVLRIADGGKFLSNPISAVYTPFSFLLLFEVYLLVYHIPQSTSNYIGKQYEIITLIVVRRLFKDISQIDLTTNWFEDTNDLQFTYDIVTTLLLFLLIYFYHKLNDKDSSEVPLKENQSVDKVNLFIQRKKLLAVCLVPIILVMSIYSFGTWAIGTLSFMTDPAVTTGFKDINNIFFDEFFDLLILTDVLLLLFSFFQTSKFNLVIRNSGFIITTILIRMSFGVEGYLNNILITAAVLFGVLILLVNRLYDKKLSPKKMLNSAA